MRRSVSAPPFAIPPNVERSAPTFLNIRPTARQQPKVALCVNKPYLPDEDRQYLSHTRQVTGEQTTSARSDSKSEPDIDPDDEPSHHSYRVKSSTNQVGIKQVSTSESILQPSCNKPHPRHWFRN